jgi:hypothetical protein
MINKILMAQSKTRYPFPISIHPVSLPVQVNTIVIMHCEDDDAHRDDDGDREYIRMDSMTIDSRTRQNIIIYRSVNAFSSTLNLYFVN